MPEESHDILNHHRNGFREIIVRLHEGDNIGRADGNEDGKEDDAKDQTHGGAQNLMNNDIEEAENPATNFQERPKEPF